MSRNVLYYCTLFRVHLVRVPLYSPIFINKFPGCMQCKQIGMQCVQIINCVRMVMCILKLMNIPMTALSLLASTNLYSLDSLREPLLLQPLYDSVNFHNKHLCQVTVLFKLKEFFLEEKNRTENTLWIKFHIALNSTY